MAWIIYGVVVIIISVIVGLHLGRFREAYTEMTGMMAGMTMGMLNGFVLGYAAGGVFGNMFWSNLFGILLGTGLGCYFGRAGGLMGIMDGGMGGVMGGSMGAMLMIMLVWPNFIIWTAVLLTVIYLAGMIGLVVLIEQSAPQHAALHRVLPMFTRAMAAEAAEEAGRASTSARRAPIDDYYTFLGVSQAAQSKEITAAYLNQLSIADEVSMARAERAYSILTDPNRRRVYDARLAASVAAGDCCPPPRRKRTDANATVAVPATAIVGRSSEARAPVVVTAAKITPTRRIGVDVAQKPVAVSQSPSPTKKPAPKYTESKAAVPVRSRSQQTRSTTTRRSKQYKDKESPVSWVGGVVAFGIATALLVWWLMSQGQGGNVGGASVLNAYTDNGNALPTEFVQKLEAQAVTAPMSADGKQVIDVVVNGDSRTYKPSVIKVKQGAPVQFNLSVEGRDPG